MALSETPGYHSLSRRIVWQFCGFTLFLSTAFALFSFALLYTLEDNYIEREISDEGDYLKRTFIENGIWGVPRSDNMQLHFSKQTFPEDIREIAIVEPKRTEFYGEDGRHYHVLSYADYDSVYLVAEVGKDLMVRPIRSGIIWFFIICACVLSAIACALAWLIGRKTVRPLKELAMLVGGVAPQNIPEQFANQYPKNEIGVLAHTLEQSFQRLTEALTREKNFTRDVSHELRSPLAVMKNGIELVRSRNQLTLADEQAISRIADSAQKMEKTVYTLLTLAREEHTASEKSSIPLMAIVEQSIIDNSYLLNDKPVSVTVSDTCSTHLLAQEGMLKVLLDNLLSNAFQYTLEGEVSIYYDAGFLVVKDTGPGIDSGISSQVTEPAVKGKQSAGFGFGLSIVKRLCEHQGWELNVKVDNNNTCGGTKVSVYIGE